MTLKEFLNNGDRFAQHNGIQLTEIKPGMAKGQMTVTENHLNAGGVCQGGALFTLADLVFAALVNQRENLAFAINSTIFYHVSGRLGSTLTACGRFTNPHAKIPAIEVIITDQDGNHIATFNGQGYTKSIPNTYNGLE